MDGLRQVVGIESNAPWTLAAWIGFLMNMQ